MPLFINKKKFNLPLWVGFILVFSGLILWTCIIIIMSLYESNLTNPNLSVEELGRIEGALNWWNNFYSNTGVPISTTLILLGLVLELTLKLTPSSKLDNYLKTKKSFWYWINLILIITTTTLVFSIPETQYPLVYLRYVFGSIFVLWLPGYNFIRALFPKTKPTKPFGQIEEFALDLGASLTLVSVVGLILNYSPSGIRSTSITFSLVITTIIFATIAIIRECQQKSE